MTILEVIEEAIWRSGPGVPAKIVLADDEFRSAMKNTSLIFASFEDCDGYRCLKIARFGSTVLLTCEALKIPVDTTVGKIVRGPLSPQ